MTQLTYHSTSVVGCGYRPETFLTRGVPKIKQKRIFKNTNTRNLEVLSSAHLSMKLKPVINIRIGRTKVIFQGESHLSYS